jgi:beta-lactamase class A
MRAAVCRAAQSAGWLMTTRRGIVAGAAGLLVVGCASGAAAQTDVAGRIAAIEARIGGRVGVCAINSETNAVIAYRADERFAMASTFKWLLAAAILTASQDGMPLDQPLPYSRAHILPNSPKTEARLDARGEGEMTIGELAEAIVTASDNTAANLLIEPIGGPDGLTHFLRRTGDQVTRLDRRELELNENVPGDERDTTTPRAMAETLLRMLIKDGPLNAASREKLIGWMVAETRSLDRLRAGLPKGWRAGAKPGTGGNGAYNDVALAFPPGRKPIAIASYMSESAGPSADKAAAHAEIARIISRAWA